MDLRYVFLIAAGVFGVLAYFWTDAPYSSAWLLIGVVALSWSAVVALRNRRHGPGKHSE